MNIRWIVTSVAASLVFLTVAACGDDDNTSSTSASATATSTGASPDDSETPKPTSTSKKTAAPKKTTTPKDTATEGPTDTGIDDTTPEIDECELVTLNDISSATGEDFAAAGTLAGDSCSYDGAAGTNVELKTFNLSAYSEGNEKEFFESFASIFGVEVLASPGDEAYYDDTIGLSILDGKYELDVIVTSSDSALDRSAAFKLADKALANMP